MLDTADALFFKMWSYPLKFLCRLTGKSNYFFAKVAMAISFILFWINNLIDIMKYSLGIDLLGTALNIFITFFVYLPIVNQIRNDEKTNSNINSDTTFYSPLHGYFFFRTFLMIAAIVFIPTNLITYSFNNVVGNVSMALIAAGIYFALNNHPGKKSWVKIGIEKLAEAVKKIHIPSPIPSPLPAPTS